MIADQKCATVTHSAQCFSEPFSTLRKWRYQPINDVSLFSIGNAPFRLVSRCEERDLRNQAKTKNSRKKRKQKTAIEAMRKKKKEMFQLSCLAKQNKSKRSQAARKKKKRKRKKR